MFVSSRTGAILLQARLQGVILVKYPAFGRGERYLQGLDRKFQKSEMLFATLASSRGPLSKV
jgi:hypothetical protein